MTRPISIRRFRRALGLLKPDRPRVRPGIWYESQHEHWQGWLGEYLSAGPYGRKGRRNDARFAYHHINCPPMLVWPACASGVAPSTIRRASAEARSRKSPQSQCAGIRRHVPFEVMSAALRGRKHLRSKYGLKLSSGLAAPLKA